MLYESPVARNLKQNKYVLFFPGENVKKKWKNLRDCYAKHLRAEVVTHTGQEKKTVDRYKTWPWVKQMEIFKPFLQFAQTASNVPAIDSELTSPRRDEYLEKDEDTMDDDTVAQNEWSEDQSRQQPPGTNDTPAPDVRKGFSDTHRTNPPASGTPTSNATKRKRHIEQKTSTPSSVDKVIAYLEKRPSQAEYDEVDLICLGYAKTIKKFSPRRRTLTKFKIAQILMEEELNQQMEESTYATTSVQSTSSAQSYPIINSPISATSHAHFSNDSCEQRTAATWYEEFSDTRLS